MTPKISRTPAPPPAKRSTGAGSPAHSLSPEAEGRATLAGGGPPVLLPASSASRAVEGAARKNPGEGASASPPSPGHQMSEAELDAAIRRILKDLPGIMRYHTHDSRRSPGGFPDLVLVGKRGVLYRELKTTTGKVTPAQDTWLMQLRNAFQDVGVWRPEQLLDGTIARELAALAGFGSPP